MLQIPPGQIHTCTTNTSNEKYKGDAILQKSYTVDFLSKKRAKNQGEIQQFHIEEHGTNSYSHRPETNPFAGKVVCGTCNQAYTRKGWKTGNVYRKVWQCQERYKAKGVQGCTNRHIDETVLEEAFIIAWNLLLDSREEIKKRWERFAEFGNPLEQYRAVQFADIMLR